jgi:gliding motility-associated-like protein
MKRFSFPPFIVLVAILLTYSFSAKAFDGKNWNTQWNTAKVFIENKGQFHIHESSEKVLYAYTEDEMTVFFTATGVHYTFLKTWKKEKDERENAEDENKKYKSAEAYKEAEAEEHRIEYSTDAVSYTWLNADPSVTVVADGKVNDYYSYTVKDQNGVDQNYNYVPGYQKITYRNLYPGIDVEFTLHPENGIKYAIIVHPGADPSAVQMVYSEMPDLKNNGDLAFKTKLGNLIDHAPVSFYSDDNLTAVSSSFSRNGKNISFAVGAYDKNKTLVIDPWVQSPTFGSTTWHCVWECEKDGAGNVYIIGGGVSQVAGSQMMVKKYNPTGTLQWTYVTPYDTSNCWLGTFATDNAGNCYVTAGSIAQILKINTSATLIWNNTNPGGIFSSAEFWNIVFNCDQTKLIIGGTGGSVFTLQAYIYNVDVNTGNITSSVSVAQGGAFPTVQEVRSISSCPNGKYYFMTHDTIGSINQNFTLCPGGSSTLNKTSNGIGFSYKCENYRFDNSGIMSVRADANFLYVNKGDQIQKRSLATLALISSATIPGGVLTTVFLGGKQVSNSGIDIDACGNIYVGSTNQVVKFSPALTQLATYPTTFNVYDVHVSAAGDVIACGSTGNSGSANRTGSVQSFAAAACAPIALTCCDATLCNPGIYCVGDAPFNLTAATGGGTFSGTGITNASLGTFSPAVAGVGMWTIHYTLPCGSDSVTIKVNNCAGIPLCAESNGNITASGTGPFTWYHQVTTNPCVPGGGFVCGLFTVAGPPVTSWASFTTGTTITPGTYPMYVVNAQGDSAYIPNFASLAPCSGCNMTASITTQTNVSCFGGNNGSATATQTGGSGTITYVWTPGGGSTATATGLIAGTYTCTITAGPCTATTTVLITQPASALSASATPTNASCGSNNGSATVTAGGGTGAYTYVWAPSGGTGSTASGLGAGTYTCTVTDANGCTQTASATIANPGAPTVTLQSQTDVLCNGGNTGTATVNPAGGTPGYTYSWSPSGGTAVTGTGLSVGNYTCTVTDGAGCIITQSVSITEPTAISASSVSTPSACSGSTGTATVTAGGGTGAFTYNWAPSGGSAATAINLAPGVYTVTVTDANGCVQTSNASVGSTGGPTTGIQSSADLSCFGGSNGSATISAIGNGPFTYVWSPSGGNAASASGLNAGTYSVSVTDAGGCVTIQTVTLTSPSQLVSAPTSTAATCGNSNGTADAVASGGTNPYTYLWSNSATSATLSNLSGGSYSVTVTDANGCTTTSTVIVSNNGAPTVAVSSTTNILCFGDATGSGTVIASSGVPPYTYSWSPSGGSAATATGLISGTYTISVTGSNGCIQTQTLTLTQPASAIQIANASLPENCNDADGVASVNASGGTPGYTYIWSNSSANDTITNLSAGTYSVTATDANGCAVSSSVIVSNTGTAVANAGTSVSIMSGQSTQLNGSGGGTYLWSPAIGLSCTTCQNPLASPTVTTTYILTVTDTNGCTASDTITVTVDISCGEVYVPNAFSPNADGQNDMLYVRGNCVKILDFKIYNRWGEEVFYTNDVIKGWDGTWRDKPCEAAVFTYVLRATLLDGTEINKQGNISLVK